MYLGGPRALLLRGVPDIVFGAVFHRSHKLLSSEDFVGDSPDGSLASVL